MIDQDVQRQLDQMQEKGARVFHRLRDLTASASDDRSLVTATCAPGGRLTDITFEPAARRLGIDELSVVVLAASSAAADAVQAALAEVLSEITVGTGGADGEIMRNVTQQMQQVQEAVTEQQQRLARLGAPAND